MTASERDLDPLGAARRSRVWTMTPHSPCWTRGTRPMAPERTSRHEQQTHRHDRRRRDRQYRTDRRHAGGRLEILFARSGEQAIEIARRSSLDLILLDVMMPGLNGYETCRRLKQDPGLANVPVIFTTGLDAAEAEIEGLSAGAIDYVTKPVQPASLRRRVSNHIDMKQMRDQLANLALVDPLTGLGNRRMLESLLVEEMTRLARAQEYLSVILVDVDHFKQFNDIYGHLEGDRCLRAAAGALGGAMRRGGDLCVRYGGGGVRLRFAAHGSRRCDAFGRTSARAGRDIGHPAPRIVLRAGGDHQRGGQQRPLCAGHDHDSLVRGGGQASLRQ